MILWHVAYAGDLTDPAKEVVDNVSLALENYGWYRVVEADDELAAIMEANKEADDLPKFGEVYYVTPFESQPTRKIEVIV